MSRPEGPTKQQAIMDMIETLNRLGGLVNELAPDIHPGMWYNIDRKGIDQLDEFLTIVERRLRHALDLTRRLPTHQEGQHSTVTEPVGSSS